MCCRKSIAKPAWRASLKKLESLAMLKEKAHSMTCLFAASIIGAWWKGHVTPTGVAFTSTKMAITYARPSTNKELAGWVVRENIQVLLGRFATLRRNLPKRPAAGRPL